MNVPRQLAQSCTTADSTSNQILRYGNRGAAGPAINLIPCIQGVYNQDGTVTADKITQSCSVQIQQYQNNQLTSDVQKSDTSNNNEEEEQTSSNKAWIWILIIGVILLFLSLSGAGAFFILQKGS